ncbi:hypothetical protein ES703_42663 [subsurface metagenome]
MNHIGKGIFKEITSALNLNRLVLCLRKKLFRYRLRQIKEVKLVDEKEWQIRYGKIKL